MYTMWGPQTIAKLVYNSNNYGLWMFMVPITIVFMGFINQQTSRLGAPPCSPSLLRKPKPVGLSQ